MATLLEKVKKFPTKPGVYFFLGKSGRILYIGKALSLKDRVRSYFAKDLRETRSLLIEDMVRQATDIKYEVTDSVLEALILEAALIRKHQPKYNSREKDNKSYNYIGITKEDFPRVFLIRGKDLSTTNYKLSTIYGPFPQGKLLKEALKIIRKIFPFRDTCQPGQKRPCFNRQIGLCPGVCTGEISKKEYSETIKNIKLLLSGEKKSLIKKLEREMKGAAAQHEFEEAKILRDKIFALKHIRDVSLMGREYSRNYLEAQSSDFKIESYDIAHISGTHVVGGMIVLKNEEFDKSGYRKFKIRINPGIDDTAALKEILTRRLKHQEWILPNLIVVDGGTAQKRVAESLLKGEKLGIPVVAVTKDERHKARAILGDLKIAEKYKNEILRANFEVHRFTISYHRKLREKLP